jgi:catechol 2,3-dioxygenase-like lactoylglutathione lyase family enzyme
MIQLVGNLSENHSNLVENIFAENEIKYLFRNIENLDKNKIISLDKESTQQLIRQGITFYNWDLLFSVLGPNDVSDDLISKLQSRIDILKSILNVKPAPKGNEIHGSIRVHDLAKSAAFYTWLFNVEPKEWTHRYVTFVRRETSFNFVLLVADGKELHHDTLYHLGMGVATKQDVIGYYHSAKENGYHIEKPPRTTWRGTPLHELWIKDPDGTLIEVYARLTDDELAQMPADKEPVFLT